MDYNWGRISVESSQAPEHTSAKPSCEMSFSSSLEGQILQGQLPWNMIVTSMLLKPTMHLPFKLVLVMMLVIVAYQHHQLRRNLTPVVLNMTPAGIDQAATGPSAWSYLFLGG